MRALISLDNNDVEIVVDRIVHGKKCHIVGHLPGSDSTIRVTMDKLIELRCSDEGMSWREVVGNLLFIGLVIALAFLFRIILG